ncbi:hypothetical protein JXA80_10720 [bacterium]|nr:hypothetical protein [candidate division CSSED10-310 bacterium]
MSRRCDMKTYRFFIRRMIRRIGQEIAPECPKWMLLDMCAAILHEHGVTVRFLDPLSDGATGDGLILDDQVVIRCSGQLPGRRCNRLWFSERVYDRVLSVYQLDHY